MQEAFQDAFARLCCHAGLRSAFFEIGAAALGDSALSESAVAALESIPQAELERYAEGLVSKRWGELASLVPCTVKVSPGLEKHYRWWLRQNPSQTQDSVLGPGQREGLRALDEMHLQLSGPSEAPYAAVLFAYEVFGSSSRQDRNVRFLHSNYALHQLVPQILSGNVALEVEREALLYRFDEDGWQWKTT